MQITSGEITYSRTVNLGDYNSKKVEVKLAFSVADGEDASAAAEHAGVMAWEKCGDLLTMSAKPQRLETGTVATAIPSVEPSAPAGHRRGPGKPPKLEKAPEAPKIEAKPEPIAEAPKAAEAPVDDFMADAGPVDEPVSDAELQSAAVKRNSELSGTGGPAIKKLMVECGVKPGATLATMPQEKRAAFIAKLGDIKPLA